MGERNDGDNIQEALEDRKHRQIPILPNVNEILTDIQPKKVLNETQPREQAGFRSRYLMTDICQRRNPIER